MLFWRSLTKIAGSGSGSVSQRCGPDPYKTDLHCIKTESYIAQKCVNIHSGPDSKVMHSFTTCMCFSQSSVMMMDTSPVHRIWHAKPDTPDSWLYQQRGWSIFRRRSILVSHWPAGLGPHSLAAKGGGGASGRQLTRNEELIHCTLYKYG